MEQNSCKRCGHTYEEKNKFCTRCGAPVQNRCTFNGGLLDDPCTKVNSPHAAFCESCGSPTLFYKEGLITSPFKVMKKEQKIDLINIEDMDSLF